MKYCKECIFLKDNKCSLNYKEHCDHFIDFETCMQTQCNGCKNKLECDRE